MRLSSKLSLVALALACALAVSSTGVTRAADEAKATGTISGKVVDKDGKAVAGAKVMAIKPPEGNRDGGPRRGEGDAPKAGAPEKQAAPGGGEGKPPRGGDGGREGGAGGREGRPMPKPVAEATTAEDGTYVLKEVPAGKYNIVAHLRGTGMARKGGIEVTAGQDTKVEDLTLQQPQRGQGGPGGGGGGGAGGGEGGRRGGEGRKGGEGAK